MPYDPQKIEEAKARLLAEQQAADEPQKTSLDRMRDVIDNASKPSPVVEKAERLAGQFGSGANRGIAQVLGMPVDAVNGVMKAVGIGADKPFLGSESIQDGINAVVGEPQKPESKAERLVDRIGEEAGSSLPSFGAGLALRGATEAGLVVKPILQNVGEELLKLSPKKLAQVEATLTLGAGTGAGITKEAFPDSKTAEFVGQLVGGVGLPLAASYVRDLALWGKKAAGFMSDDEIKDVVGTIIDSSTTGDALRQGIEDRNTIRLDLPEVVDGKVAPTFRPTTAQVTNSPRLAILERAERSKVDGNFADRWEAAADESQRSMRDLFDRIPGIPRTAASIADTQEAIQRAIDARIAAARRAAEQATRLNPNLTKAEAGRIIQDQLQAAYDEFTDASNALYRQVDAGGDVMLPFEHVANTARRQAENLPPLDNELPAATREINDWVDRDVAQRAGQAAGDQGEDVAGALQEHLIGDTQISFNDLRAMRTRVLGDLRRARSKPLDQRMDREISRLTELRNVIDSTLDEVADHADPEVADAYRTANAFYRDGRNRFRSGAAKAMQEVDPAGRVRIGPAEVGGTLFKPGDEGLRFAGDAERALVRFNAENGQWVQNPAALGALRQHALQTLADRADSQGRLSTRDIQLWRKKYRQALDHPVFRDLNEQTSSLERAQRTIEANALAAQRSAEEVQRSAAARVLGADPDKAVAQLLSGAGRAPAKKLMQLRQMIGGDEQAMMGLRRSVIDHIESEASNARKTVGDVPFLSATKLRDLEKRFGTTDARSGVPSVLDQLYDPEHRRQLKVIQRASDILERSGEPRVAGPGTAELLNAMKPVSGQKWLASTWGVVSHTSPKAGLAKKIAGMWSDWRTKVNGARVDELLHDALIDPDAAEILYWHVRGAKPSETIKRMNLYFANRVPAMGATLDDDEPLRPEDTRLVPDRGDTPTPRPTARPVEPVKGTLASPANQPQIDAAETKRQDAAVRSVTSARNAAGQKVDVSQKVARGNTPITTLFKTAQENRARPYAKMVDRYADDLPGLVAVLEELKPEERQLVQKKAETAVAKLMSTVGPDQQREYMPRIAALMGGGGQASAAAQ